MPKVGIDFDKLLWVNSNDITRPRFLEATYRIKHYDGQVFYYTYETRLAPRKYQPILNRMPKITHIGTI